MAETERQQLEREIAELEAQKKTLNPNNEDLATQAASQPRVQSYLETMGRSIKIGEQGKREFTEQTSGGKIVETPKGPVVIRPEKPAQFIDKPPSRGTAAHMYASMAMPFLGPWGHIAAEILEPGSTKEFAKDVLDWTGEAVESLPGIAGSALMATGVGVPVRIAAQGALSGAGTFLRRYGVSSLLPGKDIGLGETLKSAAINTAVGAVSEGATAGIAKAWGAPSEVAGKALIGKASSGDVEASTQVLRDVLKKEGIKLDPALMTLSDDAMLLTTLLRRTPGGADAWAKHDVGNILALSRFTDKWADASLGMKGSAEKIASRALNGQSKYIGALRTKQLGMFKDSMDEAMNITGGAPVIKYDNLLTTVRELEDAGHNMNGVKNGLSKFNIAVDNPATQTTEQLPRMTIEQLQNRVAEFSKGVIPDLPAEGTTKNYVQKQLKDALLQDLDGAAQDPELSQAAELLQQARDQYRVMQVPIDRAKTRLLKKAIGLKKDLNLEFLPDEILKKKTYSDHQVQIFSKILNKTDPVAHAQMERSLFEQALQGTESAGKTLRGKQTVLAAEEAGQKAYAPSLAAENLRQAAPRLELFHGGKIEGLKDIIDGFERLALIDKELAKSPTAGLLGADRLAKAGYDLLFGDRGQALSELAMYGTKKRMSAILTNPETRDALMTLLHPPKNWAMRNVASTAARISGIVVRDSVMFDDEEQPDENE